MRVGAHAGELLEDVGVKVPLADVHAITTDDLLHDNQDLIEAAVSRMADGSSGACSPRSTQTGQTITIEVQSANLDRVDAYVDGRPVGSAGRAPGSDVVRRARAR